MLVKNPERLFLLESGNKILVQIIAAPTTKFDIWRKFYAASRAIFFNLFGNISGKIRLLSG
jgi:hypothetical protein